MLNKDFKEFIKLLNKNKVEYLLIGGYAVAFHGYPRYTKDIDFVINNDENNAKRIIKVLKEFGFASLNLSEEDFIIQDNVIQLGYPPRRIDILTSIKGCDFNMISENLEIINIDDISIKLISKENLKKIKKIAGRYQDLADIENLGE